MTLLDFALYSWQPEIATLLREHGVKQRTRIALKLDCSYLQQFYDVMREQSHNPLAGERKWTFRLVMKAHAKYMERCEDKPTLE
jgi:hypothetical protein